MLCLTGRTFAPRGLVGLNETRDIHEHTTHNTQQTSTGSLELRRKTCGTTLPVVDYRVESLDHSAHADPAGGHGWVPQINEPSLLLVG